MPVDIKERGEDPTNIVFIDNEDVGLNLEEVPIVVIYNGQDHYVGSRCCIPSFKDELLRMSQLMQQARIIGDKLQDHCQDNSVLNTIKSVSGSLAQGAYAVEKIFSPPTPDELASQAVLAESGQPPSKKSRTTPKPTSMTRTGKSQLTNLYCNCGQKFATRAEVTTHESEHKKAGVWPCYACESTSKTGKAARKHYRNKHLGEYLYWCQYCDFGRDKKYLVENHMLKEHGDGQAVPCRLCSKMFPSKTSMELHEQYCGKLKCLRCNFCNRKYKRKSNLLKHHKNIHSIHQGKYKCSCGREYETRDSYVKHYDGNCYNLLPVPHPVDRDEPDVEDQHDIEEEDEEEGENYLPPDFSIIEEAGEAEDAQAAQTIEQEEFQMDALSPEKQIVE